MLDKEDLQDVARAPLQQRQLRKQQHINIFNKGVLDKEDLQDVARAPLQQWQQRKATTHQHLASTVGAVAYESPEPRGQIGSGSATLVLTLTSSSSVAVPVPVAPILF